MIKKILLATFVLIGFHSFSQTSAEKEILTLSGDIFKWELENKIDSLEKVFHKNFIVVAADGNSQLKSQYINQLKSGAFVHDSIAVEDNNAVIAGNTAIVYGKGKFAVTLSGNKVQLRLSYMEVFTRDEYKNDWKVLAMKASILDK